MGWRPDVFTVDVIQSRGRIGVGPGKIFGVKQAGCARPRSASGTGRARAQVNRPGWIARGGARAPDGRPRRVPGRGHARGKGKRMSRTWTPSPAPPGELARRARLVQFGRRSGCLAMCCPRDARIPSDVLNRRGKGGNRPMMTGTAPWPPRCSTRSESVNRREYSEGVRPRFRRRADRGGASVRRIRGQRVGCWGTVREAGHLTTGRVAVAARLWRENRLPSPTPVTNPGRRVQRPW